MPLGFTMPKRERWSSTGEQKEQAVKLVRTVGSVSRVARDLDLTVSALRNWVRQADIDAGKGSAGGLTSVERVERVRLRRENKVLRMERDFFKKAATCFAKDNDQPSS